MRRGAAQPARAPSRRCVRLLLCASLAIPAVAPARAEERALWQLWQQHAAPPYDHAALLEACRTYTDARPNDRLTAVSRTLAAWHLLQLGRRDDAVRIFERFAAAGADPLHNGAHTLSLAWLTRLDREKVKTALEFYYRKNVGYPRTLKDLRDFPALPAALAFPMEDRWGLQWGYRLTGLKMITGLLDQKYALRSQRLAADSDLDQALALPCAARLNVAPVRVRTSTPGREVVDFRILSPEGEDAPASGGRESLVVSVGRTGNGIHLAYVGRALVIVNDTLHWKIMPRPGAR